MPLRRKWIGHSIMHTLHHWAVKAENKEEALGIVQDRLLNEEGSFVEWSDWHVVGGGRWASSGSSYDDSFTDITSYEETPDKFIEILDGIRTARKDEMNRHITAIKTDKFISDMVDYISNNATLDGTFAMNNYYISKAVDLMENNYTSDSHFYDLENYSASMEYIKEEFDKEDSKMLHLVPIDFHC